MLPLRYSSYLSISFPSFSISHHFLSLQTTLAFPLPISPILFLFRSPAGKQNFWLLAWQARPIKHAESPWLSRDSDDDLETTSIRPFLCSGLDVLFCRFAAAAVFVILVVIAVVVERQLFDPLPLIHKDFPSEEWCRETVSCIQWSNPRIHVEPTGKLDELLFASSILIFSLEHCGSSSSSRSDIHSYVLIFSAILSLK